MSGRIPRQFIDDLLVRVDIVDLIDSHLPLKKSGNNFVACCPFHNEKTPSFSVSRNRQIYHCFGCGLSGNAISFLMAYSHLGFVEAVEDLAAFVGVDVPREKMGHAKEFEALVHRDGSARLYPLLEQVMSFYVQQLTSSGGERALNYLKSRGVAEEVMKDFALGYAPDAWDALSLRFDRKLLVDAGMLVVRDDGKVYDRFRGRLMFPIRDKRKRVIGFGGRVLDDSLPKYLNSPETIIFSKGKELYGLHELLERKARPSRILVVEGYMDVITLAQFGISNAVATLGTATSKLQIELLFRFCSELIFCFDGDGAGRKAAWKAVEVALSCLRDGQQIKVMLLPEGCDPDSLIRNEGVAGFQERIVSAQLLSDYFFAYLSDGLDLSKAEGCARLLVLAKPLLEQIVPGFFRARMFNRLNELTGSKLDVAKIQAKIRGHSGRTQIKSLTQKPSLLRRVIALLLQYPSLVRNAEWTGIDFSGLNFAGRELLEDLLRVVVLEKPENSAILLENYRGTVHERAVMALSVMELDVPPGGEGAEFFGAVAQLMRQVRQEKLNELLLKESQDGLNDDEKRVLTDLLRKRL